MSYEETIMNMPQKELTVADLEKQVDIIIKGLPPMNRAALRAEMQQMHVAVTENPTTFDITNGLAKSQAYRDRLATIYQQAMIDTKIRKRCLEMLFDVTNLVSKASSADKRKGEATLKYPMQILQYEVSDAFLKEVEQIRLNMENTFNTYSRQASVLQLQVQLGEYKANKGELPTSGGAEEFDWGNVN